MMRVVVGGHSRNIGKTQTACEILGGDGGPRLDGGQDDALRARDVRHRRQALRLRRGRPGASLRGRRGTQPGRDGRHLPDAARGRSAERCGCGRRWRSFGAAMPDPRGADRRRRTMCCSSPTRGWISSSRTYMWRCSITGWRTSRTARGGIWSGRSILVLASPLMEPPWDWFDRPLSSTSGWWRWGTRGWGIWCGVVRGRNARPEGRASVVGEEVVAGDVGGDGGGRLAFE